MSGRSDGRAKGAKMKEETLRAQGARSERADAAADHRGVGAGGGVDGRFLFWRFNEFDRHIDPRQILALQRSVQYTLAPYVR